MVKRAQKGRAGIRERKLNEVKKLDKSKDSRENNKLCSRDQEDNIADCKLSRTYHNSTVPSYWQDNAMRL